MWKDAHHGRVLLCDAELRDELVGVLATPMARVPKQNPDRIVAPDGRFVHDQRRINALGAVGGGAIKYAHPPAAQPRHRELARLVLWWKARLPGVTVRLAKLDVDSAYKLVWLRIPDVGLFATELPGTAVGWDGPVLVLYLVLTFGWGGVQGTTWHSGRLLSNSTSPEPPRCPCGTTWSLSMERR